MLGALAMTVFASFGAAVNMALALPREGEAETVESASFRWVHRSGLRLRIKVRGHGNIFAELRRCDVLLEAEVGLGGEMRREMSVRSLPSFRARARRTLATLHWDISGSD